MKEETETTDQRAHQRQKQSLIDAGDKVRKQRSDALRNWDRRKEYCEEQERNGNGYAKRSDPLSIDRKRYFADV